jgi:hypothetical protein
MVLLCVQYMCIHTYSSVKLLPESIFHLLMIQNESNLVALFSYFSLSYSCACICVIVVSKTIPTITMKPTDQNGLSLSSLLMPIVPLPSLPLSVCVSLSLSLSSAFFYYRMYAQSFNTITPTNKQ